MEDSCRGTYTEEMYGESFVSRISSKLSILPSPNIAGRVDKDDMSTYIAVLHQTG